MNGGVLHAIESLAAKESFVDAISAYRYFVSMASPTSSRRSICRTPQDDAELDGLDAELDRQYHSFIESDALLIQHFQAVYAREATQFSR